MVTGEWLLFIRMSKDIFLNLTVLETAMSLMFSLGNNSVIPLNRLKNASNS